MPDNSEFDSPATDSPTFTENDDFLNNSPDSLLLSRSVKAGLSVVSVFALLSWVTSFALFLHLGWRLVRWRFGQNRRMGQKGLTVSSTSGPWSRLGAGAGAGTRGGGGVAAHLHDFKMLPPSHAPASHFPLHCTAATAPPPTTSTAPNQFLVLIMNLLLADIKQATAFVLNLRWVHLNHVAAHTPACWVQGWFVSVGDLASSVFILAIAVHIYFVIVHDKQLPTGAFYGVIGALWAFVYAMAILGIIIVNAGHLSDGLYMRAGPWCWINPAHQSLCLALHYLWIFIALAATSIIYTLIFLYLQRDMFKRPGAADADADEQLHLQPPRSETSTGYYASDSSVGPKGAPLETRAVGAGSPLTPMPPSFSAAPPPPHPPRTRQGWFWTTCHQHIFLIYPMIYVLCTTPLASARIAIMAGRPVSLQILCFAAAAISCNGWANVLLYATTWRSLVFGADVGTPGTGLETFSFMHTGPRRRLGNETVVESARRADSEQPAQKESLWAGFGELRGFSQGPQARAKAPDSTRGIRQTLTTMVVLEDHD